MAVEARFLRLVEAGEAWLVDARLLRVAVAEHTPPLKNKQNKLPHRDTVTHTHAKKKISFQKKKKFDGDGSNKMFII